MDCQFKMHQDLQKESTMDLSKYYIINRLNAALKQ